jgi:hypothetical protein
LPTHPEADDQPVSDKCRKRQFAATNAIGSIRSGEPAFAAISP